MPDAIGNKTAHDYHLDVPAPEQGFFAKGLGHGDWGAKNRLSHLFNPKSGSIPTSGQPWPRSHLLTA